MSAVSSNSSSLSAASGRPRAAWRILGAISASHMINDMMQSLLVAIYPIIKGGFDLTFWQIGLITLTFQLTASLLQPLVGMYTDRHHTRWSLPFGMSCTFTGLLVLAFAPTYGFVLAAAALIGTGSSIFHPESSRIARLASGGRHGLAQSLFQVGGNTGSALGPLVAAAVIVPFGQKSAAWFALAALSGIGLLTVVSNWYAHQQKKPRATAAKAATVSPFGRRRVIGAIAVLLVLIFSKYFYVAGFTNFYTFYLIDKFGVSVQSAQLHLFAFLLASALGTLVGGPLGDRIGRKPVIWFSILGVAPFALVLPHVGLALTTLLSIVIGLIFSSAFSAILVYAQELVPGRVGMISGLFFGFAFGMGGLGAAVLGLLADRTSIDFVYNVIAYLPLLGVVAIWLPSINKRAAAG